MIQRLIGHHGFCPCLWLQILQILQGNSVARFLGRISFQLLRENPLLGPSSTRTTEMGEKKKKEEEEEKKE
ncbi:hypothetical protein S83_053939 [Arachis hypogaea]